MVNKQRMARSCCMINCHSRSHDSHGRPTGKDIGFYRIPSWVKTSSNHVSEVTKRRRMAWIAAIRRPNITFQNTPAHMLVCSRHFLKGKPAYKMMECDPDWAPSINLGHTEVRASTAARFKRLRGRARSKQQPVPPTVLQTTGPEEEVADPVEINAASITETAAERCDLKFYRDTVGLDHDYCITSAVEADGLAKENEALHQKNTKLQHQLEVMSLQNRFCVQRLAGSDEDICFFTRFASYKLFEAFWRLVEPAVNSKMVQITSAESASATRPQPSPPATVRSLKKLPPIDELLLFLMFLSVGLPLGNLAERFGIHSSTASRIISTWTHFLFTLLGSECLWIPPEVVRTHLPAEFSAFPDTQVVLGCTEIICQTPSSLLLRSEAFPACKSQTFKAMIGMAPHGAITFVSGLYAGCTSDREIFKLSGITQLLTPGMAIMVDQGLLVDDLAPCKVYRPALFSRNTQMSRKDVRETQSITHPRVHVERCIRRVKENKLFVSDIPLSVCGSISQLFSVACYLVNFQH